MQYYSGVDMGATRGTGVGTKNTCVDTGVGTTDTRVSTGVDAQKVTIT